jgi:hypothetical protein
MDTVIRPVNATTGLVTVGASMDLYTLATQVFEAANRTLPSLAWPYHGHLTVGGVFAVGSHGSNMRPGGHLVRAPAAAAAAAAVVILSAVAYHTVGQHCAMPAAGVS